MAFEPQAQAKLDGELAWAISAWSEKNLSQHIALKRDEIESLTRHLTVAGFGHRGEVASVDYIESIGTFIAPAYRAAYDAIMKGRTQK